MINKQKVERNFSKSAATYDENNILHKDIAEELLKTLSGKFYKRILEIGCGTGILTKLIEEKFPDSLIDAVDISSKMIGIASKKTKHVNYILGDIEEISISQYDLIISSATFQWLNYINLTLMKLYNSLEVDGEIVFSMFGKSTYKEFYQMIGYEKNPYLAFFSKNDIEKLLKDKFNMFYVYEKNYIQNFKNLISFLRYIKRIGANSSEFENKGSVKKILKSIKKSNLDIQITNHIIFCKIKK